MSSKQSGFVDDWQNGKSLPECNLYMLTSEDSCDVTFVVGENEAMVTAHRYVLMSRSCVFHAMLRGPLAEREEVKVPDVPELIFRDFLRFLYTDSVDVTPDNVTGLLYLGKKYSVGSLEKLCLTNLESSLSADSACTVLEQAHRFDEPHLMSKALDVIVESSETALMSQEFLELCNICVDKVVRSEKIDADPKLIFTTALAWATEECKRQKREITPKNQREVLGNSIYHIGFPSMDAQTFSEVVVPTKILSDEEHIKIFCYLASQNTDVAPFKSRARSQGPSIVSYPRHRHYKRLAKMSSKQSGFVDDWQNGKSLAECNLYMLTSEDSCDVTFVVGENEAMVTAHRYVLMSRSCVFHAMLRCPLAEREEVKVPDVPELIFRDFLRFLYTDSVEVTPDNVTGLLYLGKKYSVGSLEKLCLTNLESSLSADSACTILEQAHRFDEADLMSKALDVIVENSEAALISQEFSELCNICVDKVIRSEEIDADPKLIFTAVISWASEECKRQKREITPKNQREVLGDSIYHIGFPSMDAQTFSEVVVPTKVLSDEEHIKIFCFLASQNTDVAPFKSRARSQGPSIVSYPRHRNYRGPRHRHSRGPMAVRLWHRVEQ